MGLLSYSGASSETVNRVKLHEAPVTSLRMHPSQGLFWLQLLRYIVCCANTVYPIPMGCIPHHKMHSIKQPHLCFRTDRQPHPPNRGNHPSCSLFNTRLPNQSHYANGLRTRQANNRDRVQSEVTTDDLKPVYHRGISMLRKHFWASEISLSQHPPPNG